MDTTTFDKLLQARLASIQRVLGHKAGEYAHRGDRLYNFKEASRVDDEPPVRAAWGMAKKHLVSVMDLIKGDLPNTEAMANEKIGGLILIEALLQEARD